MFDTNNASVDEINEALANSLRTEPEPESTTPNLDDVREWREQGPDIHEEQRNSLLDRLGTRIVDDEWGDRNARRFVPEPEIEVERFVDRSGHVRYRERNVNTNSFTRQVTPSRHDLRMRSMEEPTPISTLIMGRTTDLVERLIYDVTCEYHQAIIAHSNGRDELFRNSWEYILRDTLSKCRDLGFITRFDFNLYRQMEHNGYQYRIVVGLPAPPSDEPDSVNDYQIVGILRHNI